MSGQLGTCQAADCPKHGQPLMPCDCQDGRHGGLFDELEEKKEGE